MDDKVNAEITEFVEATGRRPEEWSTDWEADYNIAPTDDIPVLIDSAKTRELRFERAHWSLVPSWSDTLKLKFPTFNARAEELADKSTWRKPLQSHRAIVLARGYYEWSALLRALSSFEAFTEIYRGSPRTHKIAELLLLRPDVPRSLRACMEELNLMLAGLPGENGRPAQRLAAELDARLRYTSVGEVLDEGLHTWLTDFILLVRQLGSAIHTSYLEVV